MFFLLVFLLLFVFVDVCSADISHSISGGVCHIVVSDDSYTSFFDTLYSYAVSNSLTSYIRKINSKTFDLKNTVFEIYSFESSTFIYDKDKCLIFNSTNVRNIPVFYMYGEGLKAKVFFENISMSGVKSGSYYYSGFFDLDYYSELYLKNCALYNYLNSATKIQAYDFDYTYLYLDNCIFDRVKIVECNVSMNDVTFVNVVSSSDYVLYNNELVYANNIRFSNCYYPLIFYLGFTVYNFTFDTDKIGYIFNPYSDSYLRDCTAKYLSCGVYGSSSKNIYWQKSFSFVINGTGMYNVVIVNRDTSVEYFNSSVSGGSSSPVVYLDHGYFDGSGVYHRCNNYSISVSSSGVVMYRYNFSIDVNQNRIRWFLPGSVSGSGGVVYKPVFLEVFNIRYSIIFVVVFFLVYMFFIINRKKK